jgi:hypothetical protein
LVELEGRDGMRAVREVAREAAVELGCVLEVAREGCLGQLVVLSRRELGNGDRDVAGIVERNALSHDVSEERAAPGEPLAHVVDRVNDQADRRVARYLAGAILAVRPERLVGGESRAPDQHQQIEITHIPTDGIIHPVAARMTAEKDHALDIGRCAEEARDRAELLLLGYREMRNSLSDNTARLRLHRQRDWVQAAAARPTTTQHSSSVPSARARCARQSPDGIAGRRRILASPMMYV